MSLDVPADIVSIADTVNSALSSDGLQRAATALLYALAEQPEPLHARFYITLARRHGVTGDTIRALTAGHPTLVAEAATLLANHDYTPLSWGPLQPLWASLPALEEGRL